MATGLMLKLFVSTGSPTRNLGSMSITPTLPTELERLEDLLMSLIFDLMNCEASKVSEKASFGRCS